MWVEKVPRRFDFCGFPGCPLCYNWADDPPDDPQVSIESVAFLQKVVQEAPTFDEQMLLIYGADKPRPKDIKEYEYAHIYVHGGKMKQEGDGAEQSIKEAEDEMWFNRWLRAERRTPRVERKLPNLVTCDSIGGEEIERRMSDEEKQKMLTTPLTVQQKEQNVYAQMLQRQQANEAVEREFSRRNSESGRLSVGTRTFSPALGCDVVWNGNEWVPY